MPDSDAVSPDQPRQQGSDKRAAANRRNAKNSTGPRTAAGEDTYVLCEINVSAITPFPDSAAPKVAETAMRQVRASRAARR